MVGVRGIETHYYIGFGFSFDVFSDETLQTFFQYFTDMHLFFKTICFTFYKFCTLKNQISTLDQLILSMVIATNLSVASIRRIFYKTTLIEKRSVHTNSESSNIRLG